MRSTKKGKAASPGFEEDRLISVGGPSTSPAQDAVIPGSGSPLSQLDQQLSSASIPTAKSTKQAAFVRKLWVDQPSLPGASSNHDYAIAQQAMQIPAPLGTAIHDLMTLSMKWEFFKSGASQAS